MHHVCASKQKRGRRELHFTMEFQTPLSYSLVNDSQLTKSRITEGFLGMLRRTTAGLAQSHETQEQSSVNDKGHSLLVSLLYTSTLYFASLVED